MCITVASLYGCDLLVVSLPFLKTTPFFFFFLKVIHQILASVASSCVLDSLLSCHKGLLWLSPVPCSCAILSIALSHGLPSNFLISNPYATLSNPVLKDVSNADTVPSPCPQIASLTAPC